MSTADDTPIFDAVKEDIPDGAPNPELPWPNQEPVVDGIDEVSQDSNFIVNDKVVQ
jgi:hypothetical protein